ncbi:mucin-5AC [Anopheles nili]|uniref:mucin-5AC n=1 Tax=Anopheles nili TaxID=185578 RepID=UPI00237C3CB0|nr:mucin-5AC [Anopheles nili]
MNIDSTSKTPEQEEQNQQQLSTVTESTTAVLALLISPSSPSSTSTVSPTASSISKNSSTDEVDETTAEAEPHSEKSITAAPAHSDHEEEPLLRASPQEIVQRRDEGHYHHANSSVRQHECYQRSSPEAPGAETLLSACDPSSGTMTVTTSTGDSLETSETSETTTLRAQCENVTTEIRTIDLDTPESPAAPATHSRSEGVHQVAQDDSSLGTATRHDTTTEALSPQTPTHPLSSSTSSSVSSTPSAGEDQRLPVVPEEEPHEEYDTARAVAANNNIPLEDDLLARRPVSSSGCINDRFNNNSKRSDSDTQLAGDSTQAKVSNSSSDNDATADCTIVDHVLEEGVPTSAAALATEIALGQGEGSDAATAIMTPSDEPTAAQLRTTTTDQADVVTQEDKPTSESATAAAAAAPIEIVQTLPIETTDYTTTAKRQCDIIITGAASTESTVTVEDDDTEGATVAARRAEDEPTNASGPADGVVGSSPSFSLTSVSSSSTATFTSRTSSSSSSSAEASPEALAEAQPKRPSAADVANQPPVDNRQFCDSSSKGHSLDSEGPTDVLQAQALPRCSAMLGPAGAPTTCTGEDECSGAVGSFARVPPNARPLTLAEELSQAAAASLLPSSYVASTTSLAVETPPPAVADVLPKSAAGTAAAVASVRHRSTSPVLHSSLKKPNRMGVATGAGAATATTGGEPRRRVSFPKDAQLITGYLDPVNPWASISICETPELLELYRNSCKRHNTSPLSTILDHLQSIDVTKGRVSMLSLKDQHLSYSGCEALEEIFKHVQYRCIDLSHSGLDDVTASVMFDIIEYYEAANELDISDNLQMSSKSWTACINMIKKSQALNVLITRGPTISDYQVTNLAKALNTSAIHTLKLEHCVLSKQPISSLCSMLKRNTVLRELWLAHNELICEDAQHIANLLRTNFYIQLIDISNNKIGDNGVEDIVSAIVEQSVYFKNVQEKKRKGKLNLTDLSSSLHKINSGKNYSSQRLRSTDSLSTAAETDLDSSPSSFTLTPPITPPSTPALPSVEASAEEMENTSNGIGSKHDASFTSNATAMYTTQQPDNDEMNPPLQPPSSSPLTPPTSDAVVPPNANLVEMSTKNSVSLQTISDREKLDATVSRPAMVTPEEEALMMSSSGRAAATVLADGDDEKKMSTSAETVQTDNQKSTVKRDDESLAFLMSLESHADSPVPQAPKKARLAKQDSVLSEFEATLQTSANMGGAALQNDQSKHQTGARNLSTVPTIADAAVAKDSARPITSLMEEDVTEVCADYDDDGSNLRISEENLFVDLGIPALCDDEATEMKSSSPAESSGDVFISPIPPLKKDELQLLIEKSQQNPVPHDVVYPSTDSTPRDIAMEPQPVGGGRERKSAISSDERPEPPPPPQQAPTVRKGSKKSSGSGSFVLGKDVQMVQVEIRDNVPLSRSFDSVGGDESDFESNSPFRTTAPSSFPNERSFSSESLNSETSIDSNDSKSSLKIHESKFAAKNGTLERQQSNVNRETNGTEQAQVKPSGLQVLVLWNNAITLNSVRHFSQLLEKSNTIDTLNVGSNLLCDNFVDGISGSLKSNTTLTNLGLQGAHLSDRGAKAMAEIIEFGGNASLQRIDLRNNNIQKAGLEALNESMKSNKSVTRIDLDDTPRSMKDPSLDGVGSEYSRLVNNIRAQCERNKNPPGPSEPVNTSVRRARANYLSSRKISLTCQSIKTSPSAIADKQHLLDPNGGCKKPAGGRLRSPLPSPIPSPSASPVPSPSRNRFHVSRVTDSTGGATGGSVSSPSPSSTGSSPTLFFPSNSRFRVVTVTEPDSVGTKSANNPHRSSSTMSMPGSSKSSLSSVPSTTISRRPVCSSAPTLSSFPSSPLSPLAAGVPAVTRSGAAHLTSSALLPPAHGNAFNAAILQTPMIATSGTVAGFAPAIVMPTLATLPPNSSLPLGIPQPFAQLQQPMQSSQFVPMLHQQPQNYHFVTAFGPGNTPIPLQPMGYQVAKSLSNTDQQSPSIPQATAHHQQPVQYTTLSSVKVRQTSAEPQHQHQHSSSSNSTLHDSVLSSTSIESPDLEVKRFMSGGGLLDDSCCSSISSNSIDSIDNSNFNINASISSTDESFDFVVTSPPPANSTIGESASPSSNVTSTASLTRPLEEESTLIPKASQAPPTRECDFKTDAQMSLSSSSVGQLNMASSQESLYDLNDLSGSSNSSLMVVNAMPTAKTVTSTVLTASSNANPIAISTQKMSCPAVSTASNSNESTLTSNNNLEKEPVVKTTNEKAPRVRKTSWILGGNVGASGKHADSSSSGGSTPTPSGGSGYPPAIEKLLSIFNPSSLFSSNKGTSSASPPPSAAHEASSGGSQPPSRKESPMGGLFYWAHHNTGNSNNTSPTNASNAKKSDEDRAVLKVNVSPETTLTPQQLQPLQNQVQAQAHAHHMMAPGHQHVQQQQQQQHQQSAEHMPPELKVEMKENISPENTITNKLLLSSNSSSVAGGTLASTDAAIVSVITSPAALGNASVGMAAGAALAASPHVKVIFQLGGDYDESEDDIDTLTNKYGNHPSVGAAAATGGIHYYGGSNPSGPNSLLGSTTSNSSGISIGSGTSTGESGAVASPSPSAGSGQSAASDTVVVLSHLGQLARDSLSMFKNPSLTSQDSFSVRSLDSLTEMAADGTANTVLNLQAKPAPPSSPLGNVSIQSDEAAAVRSTLLTPSSAGRNVAPYTPVENLSTLSQPLPQMAPSLPTPSTDRKETQ